MTMPDRMNYIEVAQAGGPKVMRIAVCPVRGQSPMKS
jgi:hypothetical protein